MSAHTTMIEFDPQAQRVHLARCACRKSEHTVDAGCADPTDPQDVAAMIESEGGPSTFSTAKCIKELR